MPDPTGKPRTPELSDLSAEELKSFTHGEFWIPEHERVVYQEAIRTLNDAGIPYIVSGLYAIYEYTGIYRKTKDLDLLFEPGWVIRAAEALKGAGFRTTLTNSHWLAKARKDGILVDLVFGMANGLHLIDELWVRHARTGILAAHPVRIAPPEELILHRLFISERHRTDVADIAHLVMARGAELDWERLIWRIGDHWRLLLSQIHFFDYVYPGRRRSIPQWVRTELYERAWEDIDSEHEDADMSQGTLVSRFSFAIDVNEWGFRDLRTEAIDAARALPIIQEIAQADVWDEGPSGAIDESAVPGEEEGAPAIAGEEG